jgi:tetratricopeptide (TPR) repeat protein
MASRAKITSYESRAFAILDTLNNAAASRQYLQDFGKRILAAPQNNAVGVLLWAHWLMAKNPADETQKSLSPLLDSISGRSIWIDLAADIPDPNAAAKWLDAAGTAINTPSDSAAAVESQKIRLARALKALADRANIPAELKTICLKTAIALLEPIALRNGAPLTILESLVAAYEAQENYTAAAGLYRQILKTDANNAGALNNLANVLAKNRKKDDGPEALRVIGEAIKLAPRSAAIYDTQATVNALLIGDTQTALRSVQQAMALDPTNPEWRVSRIWVLSLGGQRDLAATEFNQLKQTVDVGKLTPETRQKIKETGLQ